MFLLDMVSGDEGSEGVDEDEVDGPAMSNEEDAEQLEKDVGWWELSPLKQ